ncbi:ethanolamine utilization protein EutN [Brevibacillus fluminis]|uniref:Ethanolamine utilization protein EutN n=1 Tax=Brevibacillus fluminis TaxID=511487 RepID=A0A3M8DW47_9BACL|nr:EutN/CcmL family microcompartment protein [Brevibacillus fluminis]RNB91729.1 ethanolamine utilization protein EutN [Brevibacillus fluminis]
MFMGKVIGSVWSTQKETGMENLKLLLVQPFDANDRAINNVVVAADRIGAGVGERVIVAQGSPARILFDQKVTPVDAVVVGIVDSYEMIVETS